METSDGLRVRMLLVHQYQGFRDRGVSLSFSYNPAPWFGIGTSGHGRDYRLGYGLTVAQGGAMHFDLGVYANRRESVWARGARSTALEADSPRAGRDGSQAPADPQLAAGAIPLVPFRPLREFQLAPAQPRAFPLSGSTRFAITCT